MFKQGGRYYLITSAATGWESNQAQYASATNIAGPWSSLTNLGDGTTFDTQSAFVIPYVGSQATTYIFAGDRWQDPDLVSSKYIWIPIQISGTSLTLNDYAQWQLDVTTGHWSDDQSLIPQTNWSLVYADSQETQKEDGKATNAFDGSTSTFWHTQYTGSAPALPHEIQIDLGATYGLDGFHYVARQDDSTHGMVADLSVLRQQRQDELGDGGRDRDLQRRHQRAAGDVHPQGRALHSVRRALGGWRQPLDQHRRAAHGGRVDLRSTSSREQSALPHAI